MKKKPKKNKKRVSKKQNINKKKIIISVSAILFIILLIILLVVLLTNKPIECSRKTNKNGVKTSDEMTFKLNDKKIDKIVINKTLTISKKDNNIDYLGAVKSSLEETYKNLGVDCSIKRQDDKLIIKLIYNKEKEYILDNVFIDMEDAGLSINVISEDREGSYAKIDLSKEYNDKNIIKILEKSDYKCK